MAAPKGNKNALGNKGGRPPFFDSPEKLQGKIDEYFENGANKRTIAIKDGTTIEFNMYTICGLALYLGFSSRQSLLDYQDKIEFTDIIKRAKLTIEMYYEENLSLPNPTGSIFALKNMNWDDKQTIDQNINGNLNVTPLEFFRTNKDK